MDASHDQLNGGPRASEGEPRVAYGLGRSDNAMMCFNTRVRPVLQAAHFATTQTRYKCTDGVLTDSRYVFIGCREVTVHSAGVGTILSPLHAAIRVNGSDFRYRTSPMNGTAVDDDDSTGRRGCWACLRERPTGAAHNYRGTFFSSGTLAGGVLSWNMRAEGKTVPAKSQKRDKLHGSPVGDARCADKVVLRDCHAASMPSLPLAVFFVTKKQDETTPAGKPTSRKCWARTMTSAGAHAGAQ